MANSTLRALSHLSVLVEHRLDSGTELTGVVPQKSYPSARTVLGGTEDDVTPVAIPAKMQTWAVARPDDTLDADSTGGSAQDGNGLFDFESVFRVPHTSTVWLTAVYIKTDAAWTAAITSGLDSGDATTLDETAEDIVVASGTGSGYEKLNIEIPHNCRLRITTTGNVAEDSWFRAQVTLTTSDHGRLIS